MDSDPIEIEEEDEAPRAWTLEDVIRQQNYNAAVVNRQGRVIDLLNRRLYIVEAALMRVYGFNIDGTPTQQQQPEPQPTEPEPEVEEQQRGYL